MFEITNHLINILSTEAQSAVNMFSMSQIPEKIPGVSPIHNNQVCSTWGNFHVKTFDGDVFQLHSTCNYVLTSLCTSSYKDFNIQIRRQDAGGHSSISNIVIMLEGTVVELSKGSVVIDGKTAILPFSQAGVLIEKTPTYIKIKAKLGLVAIWNEEDSFLVELDLKYKNQTCGLCGDFNGVQLYNEFYSHGMKISPTDFANFWKMDGPTESCSDYTPEATESCNDKKPLCEQVLTGVAFNSCLSLLDVASFTSACVADLCHCGNGVNESADALCLCNTVSEFSRHLCENGQWKCTEENCPGSCSVEGGAHINTFDGKVYTFHGDCSYVLTKVITIQPNGKVFVNGLYAQLPFSAAGISAFKASSFYLLVQTSVGVLLEVQLQPVMQLYLTVTSDYQAKTCGLCGNFNGNQADDFLKLSGVPDATAAGFVSSWRTHAGCADVKSNFENPCSLSLNNGRLDSFRFSYCCELFRITDDGPRVSITEKYAQHWCSMLSDPQGVFTSCHSEISPDSYKENCMYDSCNCEKSEDCMCAAVSSYVHACAAAGIQISGWRKNICGKYASSCPSSMVYSYNITSSSRTCRCIGTTDLSCHFSFPPIDGCICAEGTYLDDSGNCVPSQACPCYDKDTVVPAGQVINKDGVMCTCKEGKLNCIGEFILQPCKLHNTEAPDKWHPNTACVPPMRFFNCSSNGPAAKGIECEKSCNTLDMACVSTGCISGCMCPYGMISDGKGGCIKPEACSCVHNGISYQPGETTKVDCNTCTCEDRKWQCTTNQCDGTCSVYGDGHYMTFDQKRFTFDGSCEYVLTEDYCGSAESNGTFRVITENIPCGTTGTTCSKTIKVFLGTTELILTDGSYQLLSKDNEEIVPFRYSTVGIYLVVEANNGLILMWDRKTSLFIKLSPKYKGRVCGLCGNYDSNANNDFTTRCHAVVVNPLVFGNSWKDSPSCPDAQSITYPCTANPYRYSWAQKKCSIIQSDVFAGCHSIVDPAPYYEACVFDSCACDTGGDCECFCTAVAAYAESCNQAGICIRWRTPKICPLFCDYYNPPGECEWHYMPCGSPCMKTCRNPSGNCSTLIPPLEACTCTYNGNKYPPGNTIYNTTDGHGNCITAVCGNNGTIDKESYRCLVPTWTPNSTPTTTTSNQSPTTFVFASTTQEPVTVTTKSTAETSKPLITPTTTKHVTEIPCQETLCYWSEWINSDYPEYGLGNGDNETIKNIIKKGYTICENPKAVECQAVHYPGTPLKDLGQIVTCNTQGLLYWINLGKPTPGPNGGEDESIQNIISAGYHVCSTPQEVQCRAVLYPSLSLSQLGQAVTCNKDVGLICNNKQQGLQQECFDYEIKFKCCGCPTPSTPSPTIPKRSSTTISTAPSTTTKTTTMTQRPTTTSTTSTTTKTTTTTQIPTTTSQTSTTSETTTTTQIPTTTYPTMTTSTTSETTTLRPSTTTLCPGGHDMTCVWTDWINLGKPTQGTNGGEDESIQNIISAGYHVCSTPQEVQCRAVLYPSLSLSQLGQAVTCNKDVGLICNNKQQGLQQECFDYEIKFKCCGCPTPSTPSPTIPKRSSTTISTAPSTTTKTTTMTQRPTTTSTTSTTTKTTTTTQIPTTTSQTSTTSETTTTTQIPTTTSQTSTTSETTTTTQIPTTTYPTTTSTTTKTTTTIQTPTTTSPTMTTSTTSETTTLRPSTTTLCPGGHDMTCVWTDWINLGKPTQGTNGGEDESIQNIISAGYHVCSTPQEVQCRAVLYPSLSLSQLGQAVTCNKDVGLICNNKQQGLQQECFDYEIKFKCCGCPTPSTPSPTIPKRSSTTISTAPSTTAKTTTQRPTTTSPTSTTTKTTTTTRIPTTTSPTMTTSTTGETTTLRPSTTTLCPGGHDMTCVWTDWINLGKPTQGTNGGEDESIQNIISAGYHVCSTPQEVQCRAVLYPSLSLSQLGQAVTCNKDVGLICNNKQQGLQQECFDYEIKFKCCGCPTPSTPSPTIPKRSSTTISTAPSTTAKTTTTTQIPTTTSPTSTTTKTTTTTQIPTTTSQTSTTSETTTTTQIPTTTSPTMTTSTTSETTTLRPSTTTLCPGGHDMTCVWTDWINLGKPTQGTNGGEDESIQNIISAGYHVCSTPQEVQCRAVLYPSLSLSQLGQAVTCNKDVGLICNNKQQGLQQECFDYEIKFKCYWINLGKPTQGTNGGEDESIQNIISAGYHVCSTPQEVQCRAVLYPSLSLSQLGQALTCNKDVGLICNNKQQGLQQECFDYEIKFKCCGCPTPSTPSPTIPKRSSTTISTAPSTTAKTTTTTQRPTTTSPTSTTTKTTTTTQIPTTTSQTSTTSETTTTTQIPTTTSQTSTTSETTTLRPSTTTLCPGGHDMTCVWTDWINLGKPTQGTNGGEDESIQNIISAGYHVCSTPQEVQCRAVLYPSLSLSQLGQAVTCNKDVGLICNNKQQGLQQECFDYEIKFKCYWINLGKPTQGTNGGEDESIQNIISAGYHVCSTPQEVQCRAVLYPSLSLSQLGQAVTCNKDVGLICNNKQQGLQQECFDYEIKFKCCGCPTPSTPSPTIPKISSTTISTAPSTTTKTTTTTQRPTTTSPTSTTKKTTTTTQIPTTTPTITPSTPTKTTTITQTPTTTSPTTTPSTTTEKSTTTKAITVTTRTTTEFPVVTRESSKPPTAPLICHCYHNGTEFSSGSIVYNKTDYDGYCYTGYCSENCSIILKHNNCSSPLPCFDVYPPRKHGESWKEKCRIGTCDNGHVTYKQAHCPTPKPVVCANNFPAIKVQDDDECCYHYECQCICYGWGDPHYVTFDGTYYSFQGNCSYWLVKEILLKYNFSVMIDNYYCGAADGLSCPQSITVFYKNYKIFITQKDINGIFTNQISVNDKPVRPAYQNGDFRVTTTGIDTVLIIPKIHAKISFSGLIFGIYLPFSEFGGNTQGQCGTCDNNRTDDCMLPSGKIDPSCPNMAHEWHTNDSYCERPFHPTPSPTAYPCDTTICEIIKSRYNQKFIYAVSEFNDMTDKKTEGCHCPKDTILLSSNSNECVPTCEICRLANGKWTKANAKWIEGCEECICEEDTLQVTCRSVGCPTQPPLSCDQEGQVKVTDIDGCCQKEKCECDVNRCPDVLSCPAGYTLNTIMGVCCHKYTCGIPKHQPCHVSTTSVYLESQGCQSKDLVNVTSCSGACGTNTFFSTKTSSLQHTCSCCQELATSMRQTQLFCPNNTEITYTYMHINACGCLKTECAEFGQSEMVTTPSSVKSRQRRRLDKSQD
ncbi:hypothetical protein PAMA_000019 [Pampus argenteus]